MEHDNIVNNNYKLLKSCLYASKIRFPRCYVYMYPFYMLILYFKIYQRSRNYKLKYCPNKVFKNLLELHRSQCRDVNNMIIVNNKQIKKEETFGKLFYRQHNKLYQRIVFIYNNDVCKQQELISNCTMKWNLFNARKDSTRFHLIETEEIIVRLKILEKDEVKFANEIELCLINNPHEITEGILDTLIKNYFSSPKIVYKNDIIKINVKLFAPEIYYAKQKPNFAKSVFLKCTKLFYQNKAEATGCFCVLNVTTFKQSSKIQGFLPQRCQTGIKNFSPTNDILNWNIDFCPTGLISYAKLVERSIKPFLGHGQLDGLNPIFLIQGKKGIGKHRLISSISKKFGFHFYRVTNYDVTANIYAQNETKLRNIFFNAKISSPCIIYLQNFENFGKNNDGQFDERITSYFQQQVNELFQKNTFPILIFCSSNEKVTPTELKRTFLETFEIKAPNDLERQQHLEWIMRYLNLRTTINLNDIAQKTHGFLFEDFKALVNYAKQNAMKSCSDPKNVELCEEDFEVALDYMKANYNESLGAPKVPKVNWSDIGGLTDVKEEIIKTINLTLKHPELMKTSGLKRSGILLFGPPGTGKTLIAKAVATECNLCFLSVKGPELLNMYIGQSEENVREVFERARQASPCVIFFDELDSLAPNRGMSGDSGGVMDRVVSQLLAEMDGLNKNGTIFIIGATNRPDLIDPSLLRPGRFDKLLYVGPCTDYESKLSVFKALTRKFKLSKDVNLETIIKTCPNNITGADFYGICSNAWASAVRRIIQDVEKGKRSKENLTSKLIVVKSSDFSHAIENVKLSISPEEMQYFNNLKKELSAKK